MKFEGKITQGIQTYVVVGTNKIIMIKTKWLIFQVEF